ncbi:MAG: SGNH/GDSL hydrolase family protein [Woeseiaceae bacterium]|nr:SGNH/GDSL hydrolase family protein [Woeseiaceae bacterium]
MRLLAIGDSIVAGVGARELTHALVGQTALSLSERYDVEVHWRAIGKIGINAQSFLERYLSKLPDEQPDYVVVSLGVNDVTSLKTTRQWRRHLSTLFAELAERYPDTLVALAGVPPLAGFPLLPEPLRTLIASRGEVFDAIGREVVEKHDNAIHVPVDFETLPERFADDGFHPSESSYQIFGQVMADAISRQRPPTSETVPETFRSIA